MNIELVLIELPVPDRFTDLYPGGPDQQELVSDALSALASELNLTLIRADGEYLDRDFVDYTHLTAEAADRFTSEIANELP